MTASAKTVASPSFIDHAEELYNSDPLAAAIKLTDGVKSLLEAHGLPLAPHTVQPHQHWLNPDKYPLPTVPEQRLNMSRRSLAQTAHEAAAGIAPEPCEWEMDISIARKAVQMMEQIHG